MLRVECGAVRGNALSKWCEVTINKDKGTYYIKFENGGKVVVPLKKVGTTNRTGTTVKFKPDPAIFPVTTFSFSTICERMQESAFLISGLTIEVVDEIEGRSEKYHYENGLEAFCEYLNEGKEVLHKPLCFTSSKDKINVSVAMQYTDSYSENIVSFVNDVKTSDGGSHEVGFKTAITKVLNDYAKANGYLKGKDKSFDGSDVREGLTAIISVQIPEDLLQFEGQTKSKLGTPQARTVVESIVTEKMTFPEPVIELAIEPKSKADQEKMSLALQKLAKEDPSFRAKTDHETGQTVIAGMGELHLDVLVDRMKREFHVEANVGAPQVAYRETIKQAADCEGKYIKQSGGRGQYGHVWVKFEPNPDKGYEFVDQIVGGVVPREYIPVVDKGLQEAMQTGILAGYPMIDVKATLFDGSYHDVDSNEMAFKIAASMALKEAKNKCNAVLLEPIMKVDVTTPDEYFGNVMGDLTSRRGRPLGQESTGNAVKLSAMVPLSEMFGYATNLRSNTQGRGNFVMTFDHYEEVPRNIAEEIIKKSGN